MDNFVITSSTFLSAFSTSLEGLNQDDQECDHDDQDDQDDKDTKVYIVDLQYLWHFPDLGSAVFDIFASTGVSAEQAQHWGSGKWKNLE